MQWFIKEQVEEVATMSDLLAVVTRNRDDIEDIEEYVAREQAAARPTPPPRGSPAPDLRAPRRGELDSARDRSLTSRRRR